MLLSRALVRIAPQLRQTHSGSGSVIAGPPSNPMSAVEKGGHALFMFIASLAVPSYILYNIPEYRGNEN